MPLPPQVGIIPCSAPAVKENLPRSSRNFRGFPCEKVLKKFSLRVEPAGGFCVWIIRRKTSDRCGGDGGWGCFAAPAATHFVYSDKVGKTPFRNLRFLKISLRQSLMLACLIHPARGRKLKNGYFPRPLPLVVYNLHLLRFLIYMARLRGALGNGGRIREAAPYRVRFSWRLTTSTGAGPGRAESSRPTWCVFP